MIKCIQPNLYKNYYLQQKNIIKNSADNVFAREDFNTQQRILSFTGGAYPIANRENVNYEDTKSFCTYFEDKFQKELKVKTADDIKQIIDNVSKKTGKSKWFCAQVVSKITQFSDFSQLKNIEFALNEHEIGFLWKTKKSCSTNDALIYLDNNRKQIKLFRENKKRGVVLDNAFLEAIKNDEGGKKFVKENLDKNLEFFVLDGTNIKNGDKWTGYSMFGQTDSIEDIAVMVIEKMQNENLTLEEALNKDIIEKAKEILGKDIKIDVLKNVDAILSDEKSIAERMKPIMPTKIELEKIFNYWLKAFNHNIKDENNFKKAMAQYYDNMANFHSSTNMSEDLKEKYKEIKEIVEKNGGKMEDVFYIIPISSKSFDLINCMYAKINNISQEKIVYLPSLCCSDEERKNFKELIKDKTVVVLDDVIASGDSSTTSRMQYGWFAGMFEPKKIIFSPLVCHTKGFNKIVDEAISFDRTREDCILPTVQKGYYTNFSKTAKMKEKMLFKKYMDREGYKKIIGCDIFPYMIPDSNSGPGEILAGFFMVNPVQSFKKLPGENYETLYKKIKSENKK